MRHTARNIPPIALLILAIVMSWLSFTIFSVAARERVVADQEQLDKIIMDRLQSEVEHSYRNGDLHWIQQSLGSLGANNGILRASLIDRYGTVLADLNRSSIGVELEQSLKPLNEEQTELQQTMLQAIGEVRSGQIFRSTDESFLGAVYPVTLVETGLISRRGILWMETDLRKQMAIAREQIRLQTIALMIGFTFLALCLGVLFHLIITRRINKLVTTMAKVTDGDLDARVNITSKDEFGRLGYYFNEMLDRRQSVESALRHSQKLESIGTLASGIAHDFNNILQAISGYVRLAQSRAAQGDPELVRYLEKIESGSERATTLVKRILSFSRSTDVEFETVQIQKTIADTLDLLSATIPQDIDIRLQIDPDCPPVLAEPTQLQQVITNLVTNAVHAVDEKNGVIDLQLREIDLSEPKTTLTGRLQPGRYAQISVVDNGMGIPAEHRERLLDPFFATKDVGRGTGLGLSIVHGVVKHTMGGLLIDSEQQKGAKVVVLLPVSDQPSSKAVVMPDARPNTAPDSSPTYRVLLVDDEAEIAHSSALLLRQHGHVVSIAVSAKEALTQAASERYDIAILDYKMPEMNGFELAEKLNAQHRLPVIVATGMLEESEAAKRLPTSVCCVIRKPYDVRELTDAMTVALGD